ncbi:MAG: hypothetical protein J6Y65_03310, partial [Eggerthellaceae bacterium]|nr:hypothetical protein [Eggerthellaceae bacterium]
MNPVIVIPTFVSSRPRLDGASIISTYDHTTPISAPGELERCLASLRGKPGVNQIIVLVGSEASIEKQALIKIQNQVAKFPDLHIAVFGAPEETLIHRRIEQLGNKSLKAEIGLEGYGAIRNFGLLVSLLFGFDAVVFIDDDVVINDEDFMERALYGLGKLTKSGIPVLAKTGFYLNSRGEYLSDAAMHWYDAHWKTADAFNEWMLNVMEGPRLTRSNRVCGGILAVHKEAFKRVAFDPWVARGEDMDYMLNLRMYGSDMWFDNQWSLTHLPPQISPTAEAIRFRQDAYRWLYEYHKLEYSKSQIDLIQVKAESLAPYPGNMLTPDLPRRIKRTAFLRSLATGDAKMYRKISRSAPREAQAYAQRNCSNYFGFL